MSTPKKKPSNSIKNKMPKLPKPKFNFYWIYGALAIVLISMNLMQWKGFTKQTSKANFFNVLMQNGDVEKITVIRNELEVQVFLDKEALKKQEFSSLKELRDGPHFSFSIGSIESFENQLAEFQKEQTFNYKDIEVKYETTEDWGAVLGWLLPIVIMIAIWLFIMRRMSGGAGGPGGQIFNIGKSKAKLFDAESKMKVTFKDVAGLEGAKQEVEEIVDFLKNPTRYTQLGAKIPKGALLVGPPGTGKTLLAKAVAGEAKVPFFTLSGSDFVEMFVGVGASRVRDLFKTAKEKSPCIIFIDEIDAIGRARGKSASFSSNDERENTLNQLLTEMDGFGTNSGVILLAATNRADVLDSALLRPGRFDRQIYVDMPNLNERKEIFEVHLRPLKLNKKLDVDFLAKQTPGFSGADIANICNEAALIAARKKKKSVDKQDFLDAVDRFIGGLEKKNKVIKKEEKQAIAYHEAGHATVSWLLEHASPLVKVTIIPRGQSLGAAWYLPEERQITTTEQLEHELCAALGGRAAEEITFGKISTGALSDLEKVTKQAYAMVTVYGLNDKIGNVSFYDSRGGSEFQKPYSEKTAEIIDQEVKKLIEKCYKKAKTILNKNKKGLKEIAELLLDKEVIFKDDVETILGTRPNQVNKESEAPKKADTKKTTTRKKTETPEA